MWLFGRTSFFVHAFLSCAIASAASVCAVSSLRADSPAPAAANQVVQPGENVRRGEYLARAGDCVSCHTAPGGKPYAGGLYMPTPFGKISTPNITPDKATGIGDWSDDDFYRAMHEGIGHHGEYLYPVFPYPWFTNVTRDDVLAIKAYLFSLAPEHAPRQPLGLAFPFDIRESLLAWRTAFFKPAAPDRGATMSRGEYLVGGLGHCGECHNRHALFGASDWSGKLEGGEIEGWYAPQLTSGGADSIKSWSGDQLVTFLKSGAAPGKGVALGPMRETIDNSLHYLTDDDLNAIATYIKTAPAAASANSPPSAPAPTRSGGQIYLSNCAFCHAPDGKGLPGIIPALSGNPAVTAAGPQNVIRVVLGGLEAAEGRAPMPAAGANMSDTDIAAAVNYVRTSWGNKAPANAEAGTVAQLRQETHTLLAGNLAKGCPSIHDPRLAKIIDGVRGQLQGADLATMLPKIEAIVPELKASGAKDDDLVNALTAAYCGQLMTDKSLQQPQRAALLGNFSSLVYGEIKGARQAEAAPTDAPGHGQ
jgi:mono/diheme cytochrome c family protein